MLEARSPEHDITPRSHAWRGPASAGPSGRGRVDSTARRELVRVRLCGSPLAVAAASERLSRVLAVLQESPDYPNRRDPGVRRYLDVLIDGEEPGDG